MKKNKYRFYLQKIVVTLLCITALSSCQFEELAEDCNEKGLIVVNLGLDGMSTRAAGDQLFTGDEAITKVRIFVFVGDALEVNKLYSLNETQFANPFVIEVTTGTKDIYVVANESASLTPSLFNLTTKSQFSTLLTETISTPLNLPLVMTGSISGVVVTEQPEPIHNFTAITLTRAAAKISLQFKKDISAEVSVTKVSLLSNAGLTPIWETGSPFSANPYWSWSQSLASALSLTATATSISGYENIYVYENLTGGAKENATQLEVEALYNGIPTKYRVYINENISTPGSGIAGEPESSVSPSNHQYSLKRNHHYQLTGTINGMGEFDGLMLTTNVLPWNYIPSAVSFERIYTITPTPTVEDHTYTVGANGTVSFTFKLTSPIDASWIANLTHLADFEFVGTSQGETDEEVVITIKAKNDPGTVARTTEFYINVQYGGHWGEIPLINGSTMIGTGNRVVIKQSAN